jgi:hypothetical protein
MRQKMPNPPHSKYKLTRELNLHFRATTSHFNRIVTFDLE